MDSLQVKKQEVTFPFQFPLIQRWKINHLVGRLKACIHDVSHTEGFVVGLLSRDDGCMSSLSSGASALIAA